MYFLFEFRHTEHNTRKVAELVEQLRSTGFSAPIFCLCSSQTETPRLEHVRCIEKPTSPKEVRDLLQLLELQT